MKILIVDDFELSLRSLKRLIEGQIAGATCLCAQSVTDALILLEGHPDTNAVITDYRMKGENGIALLQIIRQRYPEIACLALMSSEEKDDNSRSLKDMAAEQGANFFPKDGNSIFTFVNFLKEASR